jgi:RNA polymerase sigma factor (TIGR02999 family)
MPPDRDQLDALLQGWQADDAASRDALFALVYPELKRLARRHLDGEAVGHTLDTTALVHEACLGVLGRDAQEWRGRAAFFALMSTVMRHVLIDHARRRRAGKREGTQVRVVLHDQLVSDETDPTALLDLESALERLTQYAPRMARVAECRLFGGMSDGEIADALGMAERTVSREWQRGKAWLRLALGEEHGREQSSQELD